MDILHQNKPQLKFMVRFCFFLIITVSAFSQEKGFEYKYLKSSSSNQGLVLIFPGFGSRIETLQKETPIIDECMNLGFDVLLIELYGRIILNDQDSNDLYNIIYDIMYQNKIKDNIIAGGFSIGGNLALKFSIDSFSNKKRFIPNKVFLVDPPIDLVALYKNSKKFLLENNCLKDFEKCNEDNLIVEFLESYVGNISDIESYKEKSIFINEVETYNSLICRNFDILIFSDGQKSHYNNHLFWKSNFHSLNAFFKMLKENSDKRIVFVTRNLNKLKRNEKPHSWQIVNFDVFKSFIKN
ncbi:MAG: hypothetical protein ACOVLC_03890 [Flavobacterium sp.]